MTLPTVPRPAAGIDGVALTWMNYEHGIPRFIDDVLPILEREGVRRPAVTEGRQ